MTANQKIKKVIREHGGLSSFPSRIRKNRPVGCPMKGNMKKNLQTLTNEEVHVAFHLGLIGNNRKAGTIVKNSQA